MNNNKKKKIDYKIYKYINHPYQIIENSPWPINLAMNVFMLVTLFAMFLSFGYKTFFGYKLYLIVYHLAGFNIIFSLSGWWYDMVFESIIEGAYTKKVQQNLSIGMVLFIITEVMFFFGFFWAYFHASLNPTDSIQSNWPPISVEGIFAYGLPLVNTFILLSSGITLTWSHFALFKNNKNESVIGLVLTIILGLIFTKIQYIEFCLSKFSIADSVYGSVFYMLTGLHGFHVLIGTVFLTVALGRMILNLFNKNRFCGFDLAIWYWHFVDVVWLFVFTLIYCWGNS